MQRVELEFEYPVELVATEPRQDFRTLFSEPFRPPKELSKSELFDQFRPGDVLVINNTRVEPRRVFGDNVEVLFSEALTPTKWHVLFNARDTQVGETVELPGDLKLTLIEKGLPQTVELSRPISKDYFEQYGEPALPPYIQKARSERRAWPEDKRWYQSDWAEVGGSAAAPTASLHFTKEDIDELKTRAITVTELTLTVGLGTFLPIKVDDLKDHKMHAEEIFIPARTCNEIRAARARNSRVWSLGTTVARAIESAAAGLLEEQGDHSLSGRSNLFISPGFEFKYVDVLVTNFHQPGSCLFALVSAFAGLNRAREVYQTAISNRMRLFSYGDLSVWTR